VGRLLGKSFDGGLQRQVGDVKEVGDALQARVADVLLQRVEAALDRSNLGLLLKLGVFWPVRQLVSAGGEVGCEKADVNSTM